MCSFLLITSIQGFAGSGPKGAKSISFFDNFLEQEAAVSAAKDAVSQAAQAAVAGRAVRRAKVAINPDAIDAHKVVPGDMLAVDLFDNKLKKSKIDKVDVVNKVSKIR